MPDDTQQMLDVFSPEGVRGQIPATNADSAFGDRKFKLAIQDQNGQWKADSPIRVKAADTSGNYSMPGWIPQSKIAKAFSSKAAVPWNDEESAAYANKGMGSHFLSNIAGSRDALLKSTGMPFRAEDLDAAHSSVLGNIPGMDAVMATARYTQSPEGKARTEDLYQQSQHPLSTLGSKLKEDWPSKVAEGLFGPVAPIAGSMAQSGYRGAKETIQALRHPMAEDFTDKMTMAQVHLMSASNPFAAPVVEQMAQIRDHADDLRKQGKVKEAEEKDREANTVGYFNAALLAAGARVSRSSTHGVPPEQFSASKEALSSLIDNKAGKVDSYQIANNVHDILRNEAAKQGIDIDNFTGRRGGNIGVKIADDAIETHKGEIDSIMQPHMRQTVNLRPIAKAIRSQITTEMVNDAPEQAKRISDDADKFERNGYLEEARDYINRTNEEQGAYYRKGESQQIMSEAHVQSQIEGSNAARKLLQDTVGNSAGVDPAYLRKLLNEEKDLIDTKNSLAKEYNVASKGQSQAVAPKSWKEGLFGVKGAKNLSELKSGLLQRLLGVKPMDSLNARFKTIFDNLPDYQPFVRPSAPGGIPPIGPNQLQLPPGQTEVGPSSLGTPKQLPPSSLIETHQPDIDQPMQISRAGRSVGRDVDTGQFKRFFNTSPEKALADTPISQFPAIWQRAKAVLQERTSPQVAQGVLQDLRNAMQSLVNVKGGPEASAIRQLLDAADQRQQNVDAGAAFPQQSTGTPQANDLANDLASMGIAQRGPGQAGPPTPATPQPNATIQKIRELHGDNSPVEAAYRSGQQGGAGTFGAEVAAKTSQFNTPKAVEALQEQAAQKLFDTSFDKLSGEQKIAAIREATKIQTEMRKAAGENVGKTLGAKPKGFAKKKVTGESGFAAADLPEELVKGVGKIADVFYSKLQKFAEEKLPNVMPGDVALAAIRNAGIPQDELKYSGITEFLQGKDKVTKQQILDHLQQNGLKINETIKGGFSPNDASRIDQLRAERDKLVAYSMTGANDSATNARLMQVHNELDKLTGGADEAKYGDRKDLQLPGGENYREMLLHLPEKPATPANMAKWNEFTSKINEQRKIADDTSRPWPEVEEANRQINNLYAQRDIYRASKKSDANYTEGHYGDVQPNVVAHTRFDDRVDAEGKKMLFLQEVQSDWHQTGRKEGYNSGNFEEALRVAHEANENINKWLQAHPGDSNTWTPAESAQYRVLYGQQDQAHFALDKSQRGAPDAPFKKDWHELAMKRMIRYAAENGYDKIGWTTGEQQAERYDLSKHVDEIGYNPDNNSLLGWKDGHVIFTEDVEPTQKDLEKYIGKEPTAKLLSKIEEYKQDTHDAGHGWSILQNPETGKHEIIDPNGDVHHFYGGEDAAFNSNFLAHESLQSMLRNEKEQVPRPRISGVDLKVGGEGMKGFYDKMLPDFMNKYGKKWGAKVGKTEIPQSHDASLNDRFESESRARDIFDRGGEVYGVDSGGHESLITERTEIKYYKQFVMGDKQPGTKVHSIDITPSMKHEVIKKGQPISEQKVPSTIPPKIRQLMGESA